MAGGFGSMPSFASGDDQASLSPALQAWLQDRQLQAQQPAAATPAIPQAVDSGLAQSGLPSMSSVFNGMMNGATGDAQAVGSMGSRIGSLLGDMTSRTGDLIGKFRDGSIGAGEFLGQAAKRAGQAAYAPVQFSQDFRDGKIDPHSDEAIGGALGMAGVAMTGGLGGAAVKPGETALGAGPIRAFHGSPHDFDKFSMSAIGTGEGNQAFGHGLYFAGDEAVARSYRDALAPYGGGASPKDSAARYLQRYDGDADAARAALREQMNSAYGRGDMTAVDGLRAINGQLYSPPQKLIGRMYEVGIDADPKRLLDWDAPIASQPKVRDLAGDMGARLRSDATGGDAYAAIRDRSPIPGSDMGGLIEPDYGSSVVAAQALRDAGVPGLRYLDGNSRGLTGGSHNYVTFSDDIVSILRKYGLAGLIGGGAATGAMNQNQSGGGS